MANQYYELSFEYDIELKGKVYQMKEYNMSLKDFLLEHSGKEIFIYEPSAKTLKIKAVVI